MFLARIDGHLVSSHKHPTLAGARFVIGQRLEADGSTSGEPLVIIDWIGASPGTVVLVSTDGDMSRERFGNNTPGRLAVAGIVDNGGLR
jgi:carbon dioxide concentrating mechanism protein CcmL